MQDEPRFHGWVWVTYALLFCAAVPWYLPESASRPVWPGFPLWVNVSLAATIAIALFTAFVIRRYWDEDEQAAEKCIGGLRERSEPSREEAAAPKAQGRGDPAVLPERGAR